MHNRPHNRSTKSAQNRTIVHACSPPPYYPPLNLRVCTLDGDATPRKGDSHSTAAAAAGRASESTSQDWEQAANILLIKLAFRFPNRAPVDAWALARRAAHWMRAVQAKRPNENHALMLKEKMIIEYEKLNVGKCS